MVSGIGAAVKQVTGTKNLPWVEIHVIQEPDHVHKAGDALSSAISTEDCDHIVANAEEMWRLWMAFFSQINEATNSSQAASELTTSC
jgi:hypothetical protein